ARHAHRGCRGEQDVPLKNGSTRSAGGSAASGGEDTGGGKDAAPDPGTRGHDDSVAPKAGGRPRGAGLPSTQFLLLAYGAMRAMCVFQLPSSRRASGCIGFGGVPANVTVPAGSGLRSACGPQCPTVAAQTPRLQLLWISSEAIQIVPLSSSAAP